MTASFLLPVESVLSQRDFLAGGGSMPSSAAVTPDEAELDEGGWVLKKERKEAASIVAEEMMIRREGRTRRILTTAQLCRGERDSLLQRAQQQVRVQRSLVRLVHHHDRVSAIEINSPPRIPIKGSPRKQWIQEDLTEEHAVREIQDLGLLRAQRLEPDRIANLVSQDGSDFLGDPLRQRNRSDSAWLGNGDCMVLCPACAQEVLGQLGRLSGTGGGLQNHDGVLLEEVQEGVAVLGDGELSDALVECEIRLHARGDREGGSARVAVQARAGGDRAGAPEGHRV